MTDRDVFLIEVARRGRDSVPAPPDYATMRSDITLVKNRANITKLTDVPDVSGTPSDGDVVMYDSGSGDWLVKPIASPLQVDSGPFVSRFGPVEVLSFGDGLNAIPLPGYPKIATMSAKYGGTGSSDTVARSDHSHRTASANVEPITPGGYMSSGTRQLASRAVTLQAGVKYLVKATLTLQVRGADQGPCYYQQSTTVAGNQRTSPPGVGGKWVVQGVPNDAIWTSYGEITGTGTTITVSASIKYSAGGGFYTDYGELEVMAWPNQ